MSGVPAKRRRLDSDDDNDEYAQPQRSSPLLQYAFTATLPPDEAFQNGYDEPEQTTDDHAVYAVGGSCASDSIPSSRVQTRERAECHEARETALTSSIAAAPTSSASAVVFDEDEDVPAEYKGLFSKELLNVFLVPLDYICKQKSITDKLLAQYLPPRPASAEGQCAASDKDSYHNVYGIAPGFRWDGVVRGRGPVR